MSAKPSASTPESNSLCHVQLQADFFFQFQLHNKERVPSLALSERRVKSQDNQCMGIIILGKQEEFLDVGILNLVVVCLSP